MEEVDDDAESNQADHSVFAETVNQRGEIGDDGTKEGDFPAEEDVGGNPHGNQQEEDFGNLTKPFFDFFQSTHH